MQSTRRFPIPCRVLAPLLVVFACTGCSTFKASKGLDVGPFAENTLGMIGEVQKFSKPVVWTHLKEYEDLPSVQDIRRVARSARTLMRGVALYSTQVVSIYDSSLPDSRKVGELARYMDLAVRPTLEASAASEEFLTIAELDSITREIRASPSVLAALGAAQPLVSSTLAYGNSVYDQLGLKIDAADAEISTLVTSRYAPLNAEINELTYQQQRGMHSYTLLARYRYGEEAALDSLLANDPGLSDLLPAGKRPTAASLDAAEQRILGRLATIRSLRDQLSGDFEIYKAAQRELDELRIQADESVRLGRITLILWARAHRNLAAGISVPARIDLMGLARSAASKAASLP